MKNKEKKILILVPKTSLIGGVANYYQSVKPFLSSNVSYFTRGSRGVKNILFRTFIFVYDLFRFLVKLIIYRPFVVVINSSIGSSGLKRDSFYIKISKQIFGIKTIVFFRGWENSFFENTPLPEWFKKTYLKSDKIIVLAEEFKKQIIDAGYKGPIVIETTTIDDKLLDINTVSTEKSSSVSLLFMARVESDKGVFELLDAFKTLQKEIAIDLRLDIAGDGSALNLLKDIVKEQKIENVIFHGFVKGQQKFNIYKNADIFLFPSYHGEGMPNSVLEAMAFGLPIITRAVGGLNDFFEDGKMGYTTKSKNPKVFAALIVKLITQAEQRQKISEYNAAFARKHFMASKVARRLEKICIEAIEERPRDSSWNE